jgi:hypothetical protein
MESGNLIGNDSKTLLILFIMVYGVRTRRG